MSYCNKKIYTVYKNGLKPYRYYWYDNNYMAVLNNSDRNSVILFSLE